MMLQKMKCANNSLSEVVADPTLDEIGSDSSLERDSTPSPKTLLAKGKYCF